MCFISPSTALQRIKIEKNKPKVAIESVQKIVKQEKTENYKQLKTIKRILDRFEQTGIDSPSYIKIEMDGKSSEFGENSFKQLEEPQRRESPVFRKTNSLGLLINMDTFEEQVETSQKELMFEEFEPLFNYENLFEGKEISDLLSSLEDKRINIDF